MFLCLRNAHSVRVFATMSHWRLLTIFCSLISAHLSMVPFLLSFPHTHVYPEKHSFCVNVLQRIQMGSSLVFKSKLLIFFVSNVQINFSVQSSPTNFIILCYVYTFIEAKIRLVSSSFLGQLSTTMSSLLPPIYSHTPQNKNEFFVIRKAAFQWKL